MTEPSALPIGGPGTVKTPRKASPWRTWAATAASLQGPQPCPPHAVQRPQRQRQGGPHIGRALPLRIGDRSAKVPHLRGTERRDNQTRDLRHLARRLHEQGLPDDRRLPRPQMPLLGATRELSRCRTPQIQQHGRGNRHLGLQRQAALRPQLGSDDQTPVLLTGTQTATSARGGALRGPMSRADGKRRRIHKP